LEQLSFHKEDKENPLLELNMEEKSWLTKLKCQELSLSI
jgi:hypothetical protein